MATRQTLLLAAACLMAALAEVAAMPVAHKVFEFMPNVMRMEKRTDGIKTRHRRCNVNKRTPQEQAVHEATIKAAEEEMVATHGRRLAQLPAPTVTQTQFFVLYNGPASGGDMSYGNGYVPMSQITQQISVMNKAWKPMNLQFNLSRVEYVDNGTWWNRCDQGIKERTLKIATRGEVGTNATATAAILTIWLCNLQSALGYTYLPPPPNAWADGPVIYYQTLPGGGFGNYNLGGTVVHEVGHWFGLQHTFLSTSFLNASASICKTTGGDGIADTPFEQAATGGCPQYGTKDTCATFCNGTTTNVTACNGYGVDPTNNFMDYSNDNCYVQFTPDQINKMVANYKAYRTPKK